MIKRCLAMCALFGCVQEPPATTEPQGLPSPEFQEIIDESSCGETYQKNRQFQQQYFPITVYVNSNMPIEDIEATIGAVTYWNETMNSAVFSAMISDREVDRKDCGSAFVVSYPELKKSAWTSWHACSALVLIKPGQNAFYTPVLVAHELGHVLNLLHEDNLSVMSKYRLDIGAEVSDLSKCLVGLALQEINYK